MIKKYIYLMLLFVFSVFLTFLIYNSYLTKPSTDLKTGFVNNTTQSPVAKLSKLFFFTTNSHKYVAKKNYVTSATLTLNYSGKIVKVENGLEGNSVINVQGNGVKINKIALQDGASWIKISDKGGAPIAFSQLKIGDDIDVIETINPLKKTGYIRLIQIKIK